MRILKLKMCSSIVKNIQDNKIPLSEVRRITEVSKTELINSLLTGEANYVFYDHVIGNIRECKRTWNKSR